MSHLHVVNAVKRVGTTTVINNVSLEVDGNSIVGLIGARGAGKKKLLEIIVGNDSLDEGKIFFGDQEITEISVNARKRLGIASPLQEPSKLRKVIWAIFGEPTIERRIAARCAEAGLKTRKTREEVIEEILGCVGLHERRKHLIRELSGGQAQRVVIAELLARRPKLIVLDEPFKAVDRYTAREFSFLLRDFREKYQCAILLSDRSGAARDVCDRLYHLSDGEIHPAEEVDRIQVASSQPANPLRAQPVVFISYSRSDNAFAMQIVNFLGSHGIATWFDQRNIATGRRWDLEVEQALKQSYCLMVLLSPNSVRSNNVLDEVSFALDYNKPVFPILIEDCDIPLRLRRLQHVDLRDDFPARMADVVQTLLHFQSSDSA